MTKVNTKTRRELGKSYPSFSTQNNKDMKDKKQVYIEGMIICAAKIGAAICGTILTIGSGVVAGRKFKTYLGEYKKLR